MATKKTTSKTTNPGTTGNPTITTPTDAAIAWNPTGQSINQATALDSVLGQMLSTVLGQDLESIKAQTLDKCARTGADFSRTLDESIEALHRRAQDAVLSHEKSIRESKLGLDSIGAKSADVQAKVTKAHDKLAKVIDEIDAMYTRAVEDKDVADRIAKAVYDGISGIEQRMDDWAKSIAASGRHIAIKPHGSLVYNNVGVMHKAFPELLAYLQANEPVALVGPAGTGKTTAVAKAAEALGLECRVVGMSRDKQGCDLLGHSDANGNRLDPLGVQDCYENGKVLVLDEADNSSPDSQVAINTITDPHNSAYYFPYTNQMVKRHPNFRCAVIMNTIGKGGNSQYVGRLRQDAATLDRYALLLWDYDHEWEKAVFGASKWVDFVHIVRRLASTSGIDAVFSTRAIRRCMNVDGLINDDDKVLAQCIFGGLNGQVVDNLARLYAAGTKDGTISCAVKFDANKVKAHMMG